MNQKIIVLIIYSLYSLIIFSQSLSYTTEDTWRYMYTSIIERPYQASQSITSCLKRLGKSGILSAISFFGTAQLTNLLSNNQSSHITISSLIGLITFLISYLILQEQDKNEEQFNAFKSFIAHWPIHKNNTPPELHELLDQVYIQYGSCQDIEMFRIYTKDLFESVINFLHSKKLQSDEPTSHTYASFWHTNISCDMGNLISSIADIIYKIWKINHKKEQKHCWTTHVHIN